MDWGAILGALVPSGGVALLGGLVVREWRSTPYLEGRTKPISFISPIVIEYEITISNRSSRPLSVLGYEVRQKAIYQNIDFGGEAESGDYERQPEDSDFFGRVHTDHRIPPFVAGMTEWPHVTLKGRVEATSYSVNKLFFTIYAPHAFLGFRRDRLKLTVDVPHEHRESARRIPVRPRLKR